MMDEIMDAIERALMRRRDALRDRRYAEAAEIEAYLARLNVRVSDTPHGVSWQITR